LEALALGATDYATKPTSSHNLASAKDQIERDLIAKIVQLRRVNVARPDTRPTVALPATKKIQRRIDVVAIGTSTGGPNALAVLVGQLPAELPVPIVLVQHMPKLFTRLLAERLTAHSKVLVCEGESGQALQPGKVWIAPGDFHMTVARRDGDIVIELNQGAAEHSCRPAVDVLFRSVARTFGPHALAVVLTGMGSDGALGAKAIRDAGGEVLVQDEASSVVWGMPGAVVAAGQADDI
jgi:two-component system chemotaxis response regulator CheB